MTARADTGEGTGVGTTPRVAWVSVAVWRTGVGLHRLPRPERQYVVVPADRPGGLWRVWLAGHGHVGSLDGHTSAPVTDAGGAPGAGEPSGQAERADVLRWSGDPALPAVEAVDRLLDRYPGCLLALAPTTDGGCVAAARNGTRVAAVPTAARPPGVRPRMTDVERSAFASFLHSQLTLGLPWAPPDAFHSLQEEGGSPLWLHVRPLL
ncbi:hypothetical protein ACTWP5_28185 [Streptomyces sp. 4N509B]|uniref:hypothetical protein n=1 Tax=Streptomyces sp. 4N509B TaxID=3457413 RepID=UPI003FCFC8E2